jgi:hypothetical protein|tara:strand:- start:603 stop:1268 length:666 start_codon:yes stop_codon:yes gene_type:complete
MSLTLKTDGDFETLEKGQYSGTCYSIVDMGTTDQEYEGVKSKKKRVHISFETTDHKMKDGRPFGVFKTYTASLFESAALRKDLVSWRAKNFTEEEEAGFNISNLLGCTANIEVGHTSGGKPKIIGLFKPDGGIEKIATQNEQMLFDLDVYCNEFNGNSNPDTKAMCDVFASLTPWMQADIEESYEYRAAVEKGDRIPAAEEPSESLADLATDTGTEEDIPF